MIGRYNHLTSEDVVDKQRLGRGIKIKEVQVGNRIKKVVVKECPNCGEENNMSVNEFCWKCHFNLNKKIAGIDVIGKMEQEYRKLKEDNDLLKREFEVYKILINDRNKS